VIELLFTKFHWWTWLMW